MDVNEEARDKVISNLQENNQLLQEEVTHILYKMEMAGTVEKMMELKRDLLYTYIHNLPIYDEGCYFCVERNRRLYSQSAHKCTSCPYGKIHGICIAPGSEWKELMRALDEVEELLGKYYPSGEFYEEE